VVASGGAACYGEELAWICMILVRPDERGRGLGTRIFDEVLERARARVSAGRLRVVGLDATPAGRGLYLKRGFVDGPALVRLRRAPDAASSTAAAIATRPLAASDLDRVIERDRPAFGADRSTVIRRLARSAPELARVAWEGGRVRGYCLGRHGDHVEQLGPVVADETALALELVRAVLAAPRPRPVVLDARAEPRWLAALAELGFQEERPLNRMYLGDARPQSRPELEPAILGPEFG
jgi:predicted N-acetyltransferase YhbS